MADDGLDMDWYCHRHRTEDEVLPVGPPLGRPPQGLPLAGLAGRARRARPRGLPLDALLRLRRLHRVRHRARRGVGRAAGRRQPGHRPGSAARRRGARHPVAPQAGGGGRVKAARPLHEAGQDPLPLAPRPRPDLGAQPAPGRRAAWPTARGSRPGLACSFGLALSTGHESLGEYLDIDLHPDAGHRARRPARARHPEPARRHDRPGRPSRSSPAPSPSSRRSPAHAGSIEVVGARAGRSWPTPSLGRSAADELPIVVERKGSPSRPRRPPGHPRPRPGDEDLRRPPASPPSGRARCSSPSWPPNPAASARRSWSEPSIPPGSRAGCCEPTNGRWSTAPAASRSPSRRAAPAARRRPRTPERVRHEKGSPR